MAPTRALWPDAPILVGNDDTFNPKMNNVRKGLEAAARPVVALCDAGIELGVDDLVRAAAPLASGTGLVLALKAAEAPASFAAEIERAYIDGHQARFLFAADRLGIAVASGGVTLMTRETLQRIGNWRGFNRWIADDYSVTRSVRELGLATRLGDVMPRLPLGERPWSAVWRRQVRWARTRLRLPVWPLVLWEPAIGWAVTGGAGTLGLLALGANAGVIAAAWGAHTAGWLLAEKMVHDGAWPVVWDSRGSGRGPARGPGPGSHRQCALGPDDLLAGDRPGRPVARNLQGTDRGCRVGEVRMSSVNRRQPISTVMLPAKVDSVTVASVEVMLVAALRPGARVIVDGSQVNYMSAAGVRTFASVLHKAAEADARIVFCRFTGAAWDCLLVSGFSELLEIASTLEEATARLEKETQRLGGESLHRRGATG